MFNYRASGQAEALAILILVVFVVIAIAICEYNGFGAILDSIAKQMPR